MASNLKTAHTWDHTYHGFHPSINFSYSQKDIASGIIILEVCYKTGTGKSASSTNFCVLLEVLKGKVSLDKFWNPQKSGRLIAVKEVQNSPNAFIELISETDKRYTTNPNPTPGEYYVPYEKLLCQYVVGEVEESVLQEAATLQAEEISAREMLALFKVQITSLQKKLEIQNENVAIFTAKFEQARKTVYDMRRQLLPALPLIKRFQNKLYHGVKSAIKLADKEIPRQQLNEVLIKNNHQIS
jgi:hypothetical protein